MKPPAFRYVVPRSLDEALALLSQHGADAKLIAGGQSLVPMLNFRLLRPALLVDISRLRALAGITESTAGLRFGALTRHYMVETSALVADRLPLVAHAMTHVAHLAIRNRGTIGGSIAHADPAAEWPALAMLYDAAIEVQSVRGTRIVAAKHFFTSVMSTALEPDELITAIDFPARPEPNGWGFEEFARRHGDFAVAGVAVMLGRREGRVVDSRIALFGVGSTPLRAPMAEAFLNDSTEFSDQVIDAVRAAVDPMNDLHASAEYRRHLVGVLAKRAIHSALRRVVPNL